MALKTAHFVFSTSYFLSEEFCCQKRKNLTFLNCSSGVAAVVKNRSSILLFLSSQSVFRNHEIVHARSKRTATF
jgi:hypothetical protein